MKKAAIKTKNPSQSDELTIAGLARSARCLETARLEKQAKFLRAAIELVPTVDPGWTWEDGYVSIIRNVDEKARRISVLILDVERNWFIRTYVDFALHDTGYRDSMISDLEVVERYHLEDVLRGLLRVSKELEWEIGRAQHELEMALAAFVRSED